MLSVIGCVIYVGYVWACGGNVQQATHSAANFSIGWHCGWGCLLVLAPMVLAYAPTTHNNRLISSKALLSLFAIGLRQALFIGASLLVWYAAPDPIVNTWEGWNTGMLFYACILIFIAWATSGSSESENTVRRRR